MVCLAIFGLLMVIGFYIGFLELFNLNTYFYLPSIINQIILNEGNGIICTDACGPCGAWGTEYVLVDGECKIPDKVEDCYYIDPPMEWNFIDNKCVPADSIENMK